MGMGAGAILAHGGAVGAAFEIGFILIPVVIFFVLARWSKRKQQEEEAEEAGDGEAGDPVNGGEVSEAEDAEPADHEVPAPHDDRA
jgi:hypothetical protein